MKRFAVILFSYCYLIVFGFNLQNQYATDWSDTQSKIHSAIGSGQFWGCAVGVFSKNGSTLYKKAFGSIGPSYGIYSPPVTADMFFDLNYLTQVIGINTKLMRMFDEQRLNLAGKVSSTIFDFDNNGKRFITIQNLLLHNSGLPSTFTDDFGKTPTELLKKIDSLKLEGKIEGQYKFSELGFVVLGQVIAKKDNDTLDHALFQVLVEAGLRDTKYKPTASPSLIVPGGFNKNITRGTPGNKIANFLGPSGNAGLFSNLDNLGKFMTLMLNKGKLPLSPRIFSEDAVNNFTTRVNQRSYKNTRALGWETIPDKNPPCGSKFSNNSFGLSDLSGSYVWADMDKGIAIVMLANGQYPVAKYPQQVVQGQISDAIMTALGY